MLAEWAPRLIREMYERDVRRQYCPGALWLGPFLAAEAAADQGSAEERFSAAAVMRALLQQPAAATAAVSLRGQQPRCEVSHKQCLRVACVYS